MILSKEQRLAGTILFGIALIAWFIIAVWSSRQPALPDPPESKKGRTWEERKDSMRRADSVRYAQWAHEREQRYDSFHIADSMRRAEWKAIRQQQYDSFRLADSLWRDSVGWRYAKHPKKDTILDLNRCDTAALQLIRGIGRYTAIQIVQYRERLGGYYSPRQLTDEVFGKLHLDTLLLHFTADSADIKRLYINSCPIEQLQRHPYLRYEQARAIYNLRRRNIHINTIDDLRTLPELSEEDLNRIAPYLSFD